MFSLRGSFIIDLLQGSITQAGLKHNIRVGLLFIEAWLRGQGCFFLDGQVEDSATAELSTMQVGNASRGTT